MSRAVVNIWCFSLGLELGAGYAHKHEVCSGLGAELQMKKLPRGDELTAGLGRTDRFFEDIQSQEFCKWLCLSKDRDPQYREGGDFCH